MRINKLSSIFRPVRVTPTTYAFKKDITSKTYQLMVDSSIIQPIQGGFVNILPLGQRAIDKITKLLDYHMCTINGQKITLPSLMQENLWKRSDEQLFKTKDKSDKSLILCPTHEEMVAHLLSFKPWSHNQFPLRLYQITSKFRDELRPKLALIRSREFLMKDLYSFDTSVKSSMETYDAILELYDRIFTDIGVKYIRVTSKGDPIAHLSHEFHYECSMGEDELLVCECCPKFAVNTDSYTDVPDKCPSCSSNLKTINGLEVGHTFHFSSYFCDIFSVIFRDPQNKNSKQSLCMGSYGIGVTRLLAASVEMLSVVPKSLRWPLLVVPYTVCIVLPQSRHVEWGYSEKLLPSLYNAIEQMEHLRGEIIVDDFNESYVSRMFDAKILGIPFVIVMAQRIKEEPPKFELIDVYQDKTHILEECEVIQYLKDHTKFQAEMYQKYRSYNLV